MKNDPIATATRPSSNAAGSNPHSGKSANKIAAGSLGQSQFQGAWNTQAVANKPAIAPSPSSTATLKASAGGAGFPVDRGYQIASGELFLNNGKSPGVISSGPDYAVLGLSTSSTPQALIASSGSSDADALHFSLAGQLDSTPTLSISDSIVELVAVPEPATCAMLLAGGAMLLFGRRRHDGPSRIAA